MKKILLTITLLTLVGCSQNEASSPEETVEKTIPETIEEVTKTPEELELEQRFPDDLAENDMLNAIHYMAHQKVAAEVKWGHEQITQAKIEHLLAIAKNEATTYAHKDLYVTTLESWAAGDFSNAVDVHNKIWEMQGGDEATNSGKATRLLTAEEEEAYVNNNLEFDLYEE